MHESHCSKLGSLNDLYQVAIECVLGDFNEKGNDAIGLRFKIEGEITNLFPTPVTSTLQVSKKS